MNLSSALKPAHERRLDFLDRLVCVSPASSWDLQITKTPSKYGLKISYASQSPVRVAYLDKEGELGEWENYTQANQFQKEWNTRQVLPNELIIEFDCEKEKALGYVAHAYYELLKQGFSFSLWYAEGQRSPHIRVYDFLPDGLTEDEQKEVRIAFCRRICDWASLLKLDYNLLETGHSVQLEYAKHWRYGTLFKPIIEVSQ